MDLDDTKDELAMNLYAKKTPIASPQFAPPHVCTYFHPCVCVDRKEMDR